MSFRQRLKHEFRALAVAVMYFGCWIAALVLLKQLVLAEYRIAFHGLALALVGAVVLSKVVLVLEHVPLGAWVRARPAWVDVVARTVLYAFGVVVVLLLEKGFEGRHEYGGFGPSLAAVFQHADVHHVWVNAICLSGALFGYNAMAVVRRHLGYGTLLRMFLAPLPEEPDPSQPTGPDSRRSMYTNKTTIETSGTK